MSRHVKNGATMEKGIHIEYKNLGLFLTVGIMAFSFIFDSKSTYSEVKDHDTRITKLSESFYKFKNSTELEIASIRESYYKAEIAKTKEIGEMKAEDRVMSNRIEHLEKK